MKTLIINTHLTYPGWSEGKQNLAFMDAAKAFFTERGHEVAETFVKRGYKQTAPGLQEQRYLILECAVGVLGMVVH